jgi:hypothetical protein
MPGINFKTLRVPLAFAALAVALSVPAPASAGLSGLYNDYTKDGAIDGCNYSSQDLNGALGSIPTDVAQYDPRFKDALNNALSDKCGSGGSNALTAGGGGGGKGKKGKAAADGSLAPAGTPDASASPDSTDISSDRGFPAALIVLGGLIAAILIGTGAVALFRNAGWRPLSGFRDTVSEYYWGLRDHLGR